MLGPITLATVTVPDTVPEAVSGHAGGFGKPAGGPPAAPAAGPQRNTITPPTSLVKPKWMCEKITVSIQIGVGDCVAEGGAIRTERGSERTARLRCDWRSFAQAAKTRFESVGIVIRGNRSDAEAKCD